MPQRLHQGPRLVAEFPAVAHGREPGAQRHGRVPVGAHDDVGSLALSHRGHRAIGESDVGWPD